MMIPSATHPAAHWAALSQAERDAAYNNNQAVPESTAFNRARNEAAAIYRAAHARHLDIPYGPGARQAWDLYPGTNPQAPCLVFIHGGYWQMNGRENFAHLTAGLAAHGWSAALPGYTLAPDATLSEIVQEIHSALDWLAAHAAQYGMGSKLIVSGWSAGGQLAALALGHPAVAAGLALSGVYELGPLRDTYLNAKLALRDDEISGLSPLRLDVIDKPLAIAYGSRELPALVEDARAFHARRAGAHAAGILLPVPGADHFTILNELHRPDGLATKIVLELG
jgi:acetyl esterase/lipase